MKLDIDTVIIMYLIITTIIVFFGIYRNNIVLDARLHFNEMVLRENIKKIKDGSKERYFYSHKSYPSYLRMVFAFWKRPSAMLNYNHIISLQLKK